MATTHQQEGRNERCNEPYQPLRTSDVTAEVDGDIDERIASILKDFEACKLEVDEDVVV